MQETVVYLKKITQPEGEKKELERELSQCGCVIFFYEEGEAGCRRR